MLTSLYLVEGLAWWDWPLLTNYCPSVLDTVGCVIWLVKIVPYMTCNVFGGTLNPTLLLLLLATWQLRWLVRLNWCISAVSSRWHWSCLLCSAFSATNECHGEHDYNHFNVSSFVLAEDWHFTRSSPRLLPWLPSKFAAVCRSGTVSFVLTAIKTHVVMTLLGLFLCKCRF